MVASEHLRERQFLVGEQFTGADLMLAGILQWAVAYQFDLDDILLNYAQRHCQRPAYIAANAFNHSGRSA
jgi:glutathione S-transferase